ncbi:MAG: hypothetical protein WCJ37_17550 [Syntrophus sp. (in: bacteria)]
MPRQNTQLESEGAEFLVLGQLLIQGVPSYKTYTNMPGYDLVATNPERNRVARLQVKSRWKTKAAGFIIKNFNCDFVIIVKLNRGSKDRPEDILPPEYFVLPVDIAESLPRADGWGKISFSNIPEMESYRDNWDLIRKFLEQTE